MIPYGHQSIDDDDVEKVGEVLRSDFLTTGPKIKEFENAFASRVGAKFAVAVSNGTAALHVSCLAAGLSSNQELITTPMTFAASANCALYCNARPIFVDINEQGLIDETKIESSITEKTKILLPVHYAGMPCNLEIIKEIAEKYNLIIIEDACHALGSNFKDTSIGSCSFSDMSVFSFHPVKHITTGEGGMVTTNSEELFDRLRFIRTHGIVNEADKFRREADGPWYYEMQMLGFNYRMTDIQAALGLSQLNKLESFISRRKEIVSRYFRAFDNSPFFDMQKETPGLFSSYHLFPILLKDEYVPQQKEIFIKMREAGLGVQVHYIPVYFHPYYQDLGYEFGLCPEAENFYKREISIPLFPAMSDHDVEQVIETINGIFSSS